MIDWCRITRLREEIGAEDFREVVALFLEEADAAMAALGAPGNGPLEAQLHSLKGSAHSLGLIDFACLCEQGERAAATGAPMTVDLPALRTCFAASRRALLDGLIAQARG